jgi:geranylgeranyl pyrophosphate synthase
MYSGSERIEVFQNVIEKYGRNTMEKAVVEILDQKYDAGEVSSALKYHAKFLRRVSPIFPALIALSCKAAGGRMEKTMSIGAALTLFVEAANLHDDVIDQTTTKYDRKTVFGKYGGDVTLLAGDVLLVQGATLLHSACDELCDDEKKAILDLTFSALTEISNSAAMESGMKRKSDIEPKDYFEVIRLRAAVPEAHCKIGGILGGGNEEITGALGHYGRTYGIVGTVVDDFMDLLDYRKFENRIRNECLPLPVLRTLGDPLIRTEAKSLIEKMNIIKEDADKIADLVLHSDESKKLKKDIILLAEEELKQVRKVIVKNEALASDLLLLLEVLTEILRDVG